MVVEEGIKTNRINVHGVSYGEEICSICGPITEPAHNSSLQHRFNFILFEWNKHRKRVVKNRHGVEVSISLEHDNNNENGLKYYQDEKRGLHKTKVSVMQALLLGNKIEYVFTVKNVSSNIIYIQKVTLLHPLSYFLFEDLGGILEENKIPTLDPGATYTFKVKFQPDTEVVGNFKMPVAVELQTLDKKDSFSIVREMVIEISDENETPEKAKGKSPFTNLVWYEIQNWIPPTIKMRTSFDYVIPSKAHRRVLKMGLREYNDFTFEEFAVLEECRQTLNSNCPTTENYRDFFHLLLWLDEIGGEIMLKRYNMENVTMTLDSRKKFLELEVPGLAEKRPSLIAGDIVNIRVHEDHTVYKGIIKVVTDLTILIEGVDLELREIVEEVPDTELDVSFQLSRLVYERMHASIDQCISNGMLACLFPDVTSFNRKLRTAYHISNNELFNLDVATNKEQKTAVENILNCKSGKAPYIVFGPPGTGKTITIVEAILQIKTRIKNARILVCAPANAACDMLTMRLIPHCSKKELIRVHSDTRDWENIPDDVKPYSNYCGTGYTKPSGLELMDYSIVVCTLVLSGRYARNQKYFPDFVFIDEAAQAMEPEATVAIALLKLGKQLVLAGDPKQLGPICASTIAEGYNLGVSLLERLMNTALYQSNDPNFITMLKLNFRAHPDVLKLPNDLFYDSQLIPTSQFAVEDPLANIFIYPKTLRKKGKGKRKSVTSGKAAVEFCSVIAKERREGRSPSYFNPNEVEMVVKYVQTIISLPDTKVELSHIGVVTPYIRQVHRIKDRLKAIGCGEIEVGTTEVFQGREKRVIIISTVRAQHSLLLQDRRYKLGFIKNEKRFNVALTRAKSKLIVIGCPLVLRYDRQWLTLIEFCQDRNAYFGGKFDRRTDAEKTEIISRVNGVHFRDTQYDHQ